MLSLAVEFQDVVPSIQLMRKWLLRYRSEGPQRYERARPGELLHVDSKRPARIERKRSAAAFLDHAARYYRDLGYRYAAS